MEQPSLEDSRRTAPSEAAQSDARPAPAPSLTLCTVPKDFMSTPSLLDLPADLLSNEVLRDAQCSARATCAAFLRHMGAHRVELRLQWPPSALGSTRAAQVAQLQPLFHRMPQLRALDASTCPADVVNSLVAPPCLDTLSLDYHLVDATTLSPLAPASLTSLRVSGGFALDDIRPLTACTALTRLHLAGGPRLLDASPLAACAASLSTLHLTFCDCLADITFLTSCTALRDLRMAWCYAIPDLAPLSRCASLQSLDLHTCGSWRDLSPLAGCSQLTSLVLVDCWAVHDLRPLTRCTALASFCCMRWSSVRDLGPLSELPMLRHLSLSGTDSASQQGPSSLAPLARCTALHSLDLSCNAWLTDLTPLQACTALTYLNLTRCFNLDHLAPRGLRRCGLTIRHLGVREGQGGDDWVGLDDSADATTEDDPDYDPDADSNSTADCSSDAMSTDSAGTDGSMEWAAMVDWLSIGNNWEDMVQG